MEYIYGLECVYMGGEYPLTNQFSHYPDLELYCREYRLAITDIFYRIPHLHCPVSRAMLEVKTTCLSS